MSILLHGDCLEEMKDLEDNSIDLIFCDLPYGQTSCAWDCKIDLEKFWIQVMRIKKLHTPIFFTTTTKFGVSLIQSAPKKCFFRYDLVWVKSAPAGFLSAKKMPMRKHEMVYVFYEKLPLYDLSSHKHKFIKAVPTKRAGKDNVDNKGMIKNRSSSGMETQTKYTPPLPTSIVKEEQKTYQGIYSELPQTGKGKDAHSAQYDPPLPTSIVKEEQPKHKWVKGTTDIYGGAPTEDSKECGGHQKRYEPALPTSIVKEEDKYCDEIVNDNIIKDTKHGTNTYNTETGRKKPLKHTGSRAFGGEGPCYNPPLPTSIVKEDNVKGLDEYEGDELCKYDVNKNTYGGGKPNRIKVPKDKKYHEAKYTPPLPTSIVKQEPEPEPEEEQIYDKQYSSELYGDVKRNDFKSRKGEPRYTPALPVSVVKEPEPEEDRKINPKNSNKGGLYSKIERLEDVKYEPPLPDSMLEIKSTRGKHSTEKPVALMSWILKYYSKEGDVVLDPTMGSGSTGIACQNMNRDFIGIEMDDDIFEVAFERIHGK